MKKQLLHIMLAVLGLVYGINAFSAPVNELKLNGTNQYMQIASHADFNIGATEGFTVSMWVKANSYIMGQRILSKRNLNSSAEGPNRSGYELWTGNTSIQSYAINTPTTTTGNIISDYSNINVPAGTWYHIAMVVDRVNNKIIMYQEGSKVKESTNTLLNWVVTNPWDVYVGASYSSSGTSNYLKGSVANVRIYKKTLNGTEIKADMNENDYSALPTELKEAAVGIYDFAPSNIVGTSVIDQSGKNHNGTLNNYPVAGPVAIKSVELTQNSSFTGRTNTNEVVLKATVSTTGTESNTLSSLKMNMTGTSAKSDVQSIKVYSTGNVDKFDSRNISSATLLGTAVPAEGEIEIPLTGDLLIGNNYFWITYDIAENAVEGNKVDASLVSIVTATQNFNLPATTANGSRTILLARKLVFAPGDHGSKNYRIPALIKAKDGSLIALTDKRKFNQGDLPSDIDVLAVRSTDNGMTWSAPVTIAQGTGEGKGFGDAAIVQTNEPNGLLAIFVGGPGLWGSTPTNPIRTYISKSSDNGVTWGSPVDITDQLFGANCTDQVRKNWYASFCAAGNGLLTRDGKIMFVAAVRENSSNSLSNYLYSSSDNGATWSVSGRAMSGGDEAKVTELNDGSLIMSIRRATKGPRYYTKSSDGGATWSTPVSTWVEIEEPACNGDMIRYTSTLDGYEKNRLLHSVPNDVFDRKNVTVFLSYDEGTTWPVKKSICPTGSAYSSLTVLSDGTIGAYVEENPDSENYSLYFSRFSLDWLSDGGDKFYAPNAISVVEAPQFSIPEGEYDGPQTVALTSATEGAEIYYTLDGNTPNAGSLLYTSPIKVTKPTTIKAIALKEGMGNSVVSSAFYKIFVKGEYCQPTGTVSSTDRWVRSLSISGGLIAFNSGTIETSGSRKLYTNKTVSQEQLDADPTLMSKVIQAAPGATLQPAVNWAGEWMHGYLYVDYNDDGDFTDNGELVSYTFYSASGNQSGLNSLGQSTSNNSRLLNVPYFKIPENLADGLYRFRLKIDWNSLDPCGDSGIITNRGSIIDFTMFVKAPAKFTVTYEQPANGTLKVKKGTDEIASGSSVEELSLLTIEAVPAEGYVLKNIKVNDVVITGTTFTIKENSVVSAEFTNDRQITVSPITNGVVTVTNNATNQVINSGDWVSDQTEIKIKITANEGYKLVGATFGGEDILGVLVNGEYVVKVTKTSLLEVVFTKITHLVTYTFDETLGGVVVTNNGEPVSSASQVDQGSILTFTVNPASGNFVLKVMVNGVDRTSELISETNSSFTVTVENALNVEVVFDSKKYVLTSNTPEYGTMVIKNHAGVELANGASIDINKTLSIELTPAGENKLNSLLIDDGTGEAIDYFKEGYCELVDGKYTTEVQIAGDVSITATFDPTTSVKYNAMEALVTIVANKNEVSISAPINSKCEIFNMTGSLVSSFQIEADVTSKKLQSGLYIVKVSSGEGTVSRKVIVK